MSLTTAESRVAGISCLCEAHRVMLEWRLIRVSLVVLAASVLTFTVLGPMGIEDRLGPFERLAFVTLCGACCWPPCHALSAAVLRVGRTLPPLRLLLACIAGALFMAVPCSAVVLVVFDVFRPGGGVEFSFSEVYLNAAVATLACRGVVHYIACQRVKLEPADETQPGSIAPDRTATGSPSADTQPSPVDEPRAMLLDRLPEMLGRDIVYITVSGHYIKVVTTEGCCLILMRLQDAIAALGEMGMQVHRSYWVAHRHIVGVQRRDGRMILRLTGAHEVPVSRTHMVAVNAAVRKTKD